VLWRALDADVEIGGPDLCSATQDLLNEIFDLVSRTLVTSLSYLQMCSHFSYSSNISARCSSLTVCEGTGTFSPHVIFVLLLRDVLLDIRFTQLVRVSQMCLVGISFCESCGLSAVGNLAEQSGIPIGVMISKFVTAPVLLFGEPLSIGAAKIALSSLKVMVSLMPISVGCGLECVGAPHVLSAFAIDGFTGLS
jgi:hypothetical protein